MNETYKKHCGIACIKEKGKLLGSYMYICFILAKKKTVLIIYFDCGFSFFLIGDYIVKKEGRSGINPFSPNYVYVHKFVSLSSHDQKKQETSYLQKIIKEKIDMHYFVF